MTEIKVLRAIPDLCTGCLTCELVCSLRKEGRVSPAYARLKVHRSEHGECGPVICRHCRNPVCMKPCPIPEAMYMDVETGAVVIDKSLCIECRACADACPFEAIQFSPQGEVLKCDLCGGDPLCVKYCPKRPERQFPNLSYPSASCLEYVKPGKSTRKIPRKKSLSETGEGSGHV